MIPILFPSIAENSLFSYEGIGIAILSDCISCVVTEDVKSQYEAQVEYPIGGRGYDLMENGRIIVCTHDATNTKQPFVIYKRTLSTDGVATFYCRHISYEANYNILDPFTCTNNNQLISALGSGEKSVDFSINADDVTLASTYEISVPTPLRSVICGGENSIVSTFGWEVEWDGRRIIFHNKRGKDNGAMVKYGTNMVSADDEYDTGDVYNGYALYWVDSETGYSYPRWDAYVVTHTEEDGLPGGYTSRYAPLDLTADFDTRPTQIQMESAGRQRLEQEKPWIPRNNLKVEFEPYDGMDESEEYIALKDVCLYDTVRVAIPRFGVETTRRVIKTTYNSLQERYVSVEIGDPSETLGDMYGTGSTSSATSSKVKSQFVQCGEYSASASVAKASTKEYEITFPVAFATGCVPIVVVSMMANSASAASLGNTVPYVMGTTRSETGFTVKFFNNSTIAHTPRFTWVAIGEMEG